MVSSVRAELRTVVEQQSLLALHASPRFVQLPPSPQFDQHAPSPPLGESLTVPSLPASPVPLLPPPHEGASMTVERQARASAIPNKRLFISRRAARPEPARNAEKPGASGTLPSNFLRMAGARGQSRCLLAGAPRRERRRDGPTAGHAGMHGELTKEPCARPTSSSPASSSPRSLPHPT